MAVLPDSNTLRRQGGQTLPLIVVFMLVVLAFAGAVIDIGNGYRVQTALQASTDAAAAAGAGQLTLAYPPSTANAISEADAFGSRTGGKNLIAGVPGGNVTENVTTSCVESNTNLPCNNANTVTVTQSANVPTFLLRVLGIDTIPISATAKACSPCNEIPLDIQLVVDRTGSMADSGGATNGEDKWQNLQDGLEQGFLPGLDSGVDNVGLSTLPPDVNGTNDVCRAASTDNYNSNNPTYTVVPLTNSYMDSSGNLISGSPLISDINCMKPGGGTDYDDALVAADNELNTDGRTGVQKIIVLLSDGAANEGQNCQSTTVHGRTVLDSDPKCMQPCQSAVNDADTFKAQGVLIYTILYGNQSGGPACQDYTGANEAPFQEPWTAMQNIASPGDYFADPDPDNLISIFQQIASDMAAGSSRIVG